MTSSLRNKKHAWLVSKLENEMIIPVCIAPTFRAAYTLGCFEARIARPNMKERTVRNGMNRTGAKGAWIFDLDRFLSYEEARYSPIGIAVKLEKVPIRKV